MKFSGRLDENIREIKERFTDCGDIISRCLNVGEKRLFLVYVDSMITEIWWKANLSKI